MPFLGKGKKHDVHKERKAGELHWRIRPRKLLPPKRKTDSPNPNSAARISRTPRRRVDSSCHSQPTRVEQGNGECDSDAAPEDVGVALHLRPAAAEVEEWGGGLVRGEEGECEHYREGAKEAFVTNCEEGLDAVDGHDLLFDDELSRGAV